MKHSSIVGGSTAKRVINCPASVKLVQQMPPQQENQYMAQGTLCHNAIDFALNKAKAFRDVIGMRYGDQVMTEDLYEEKIVPALKALEEIDPDGEMEFVTEIEVSLNDLIPGVFGNADLIGKIGKRAIVLDWKFGDGVPVSAEENEQGMFYALAAMHTAKTHWAFEDVEEIEIIIVQPPHIRRWVTTHERIAAFGAELVEAVRLSETADPPMRHGEHCRFCAAKPICPVMTGAVDRAVKVSLEGLPVEHINAYLKQADLLEDWIKSLRDLAYRMADEGGIKLPDWKLVQKRATRKWKDEADASVKLSCLTNKGDLFYKTEFISPAQAEKVLKKLKLSLPAELVESVSSGTTLAPRDDPRPEALQIGQQLTAALSKLA